MNRITVEFTKDFTEEEALDIASSALMWNKSPENVAVNKNVHVIGHSRRIDSTTSIPHHATVTVSENRTHFDIRKTRMKDYNLPKKAKTSKSKFSLQVNRNK